MARTKQTARRNTGGKPRNPRVKLKTKVRAKTTLSRGDVVRQTAEKFETSAQYLALTVGKRTFGALVSEEFLNADGDWISTIDKDGQACWKFSTSDKNPAVFDGREWKDGVHAAYVDKLGAKYANGNALLEEGILSAEEHADLTENNQKTPQFWFPRDKDGEQVWKPFGKYSINMISFCDSKGNTKRFENKLNKVAPRKARTPSPKKITEKKKKKKRTLEPSQPAPQVAVPRRKKAKKVTNPTLATAKTSQFRGPLFFVETA